MEILLARGPEGSVALSDSEEYSVLCRVHGLFGRSFAAEVFPADASPPRSLSFPADALLPRLLWLLRWMLCRQKL
jgi:hypothetical protein